MGNERGGLRKLADVVSYVKAQAGKKISAELAEDLEAYLANVILLVEGVPIGADVCDET